MVNFTLVLIGLMQLMVHPFYVSITEIRYNEKYASLEIAQKIFWDDLEVVLSDIHGNKVDFLNPSEDIDLDDLLEQYLLRHNQITLNSKKVKLNFLGYEVEEDAAWFYMEAIEVNKPENVLIKNTVLFDQFPSQKNIINFYLEKTPRSLITRKSRPEGSLRF